MIMRLSMRIIILHKFLVLECLQFGEPGCQLTFVKIMLNKRCCFADRLIFLSGRVCCWIMNSKSFDEHESAWFQGIYERLCDSFTFFLGDVIKDRHCNNGVVKIGRELYGSYVGNFTIDIVQAL